MLTQVSEITTPLHSLRAGTKFFALVITILFLVAIEDLRIQIGFFLVLLLIYASFGKRFLKAGFRALRPLWFFLVVILIWHAWRGDILGGLVIGFRLLSAVSAANLFSMTTRLSDLLEFLMIALKPLKYVGINPSTIALSIALTMRSIPVLRQKWELLSQSWRARSVKRASWKIIVPMSLIAIDDAHQIADSLRARGGIRDERK